MTDANRIKQVSGWIEEAMNDPDNFSPLNIAKEISAIYLTEHMREDEVRLPSKPYDEENAVKRFEEQALCRQGGE